MYKGYGDMDLIVSADLQDQAYTLPSVASARDEVTIEFVMGAWLHEKFNQSQSNRTKATYQGVLRAFRTFLLVEGLDVTMSPPADGTLADVEERLATRAQVFASMSLSSRSETISPATRNKRLAILSSFYVFASRRHRRLFPFSNPISLVERSKVQPYGKAKPLDAHTVNQGLSTLDTTTMQGARDKALLAVLLQTGRRVSEVTNLTWSSVEIAGGSSVVTLHFERTKGGDVMKDTLPRPVSQLLLQWLQRWYGGSLLSLPPDAPLWVNVAPYHEDYGKPLKYQGVAGMVKHCLGTSKVHRTRHTFSKNMLKVGATVKDVQLRLGHKNIATTQIYTEQITSDENPFADQLTALLGLHAEEQE
jgi:integrase/recombinase XerC